jgi:KaiC/GvpD/RAD55 family RecA-like ATPase
MTTAADRFSRHALEDGLLVLGRKVHGRNAQCPQHDDRTPSASILESDDGHWRVFCHVCNQSWDALDLAAMAGGPKPEEVMRDESMASDRPRMRTPPKIKDKPTDNDIILPDKPSVVAYAKRIGNVESWHLYGPKDSPVLIVARIIPHDGSKKTFRQFTPVKDGFVPRNLVPRGQIPLYLDDRLAVADRVLVVEGEKCAEACRSVGVVATTSAMGAGKAKESNWSPLAGKVAVLWPDNDEPGRRHMEEVRSILLELGSTVYVIDPEGLNLGPKGDVADLIASMDAKEQDEIRQIVHGIMDDAIPDGPVDALFRRVRDIQAGAFESITWGIGYTNMLAEQTLSLIPGSVVSMCADPGAGKSAMMLQAVSSWIDRGIKVAIMMLEDDQETHLMRSIAQSAHESRILDPEWVQANADLANAMITRHAEKADAIGRCMVCEGDAQRSLSDIAAWIEDRAKVGCRVIVVDPVTAAKTEKEPWAADTKFLMQVKKIARENKCSVVLVTHPRGKNTGSSLGGMAGGSAYPRFSHCALWLSRCRPMQTLSDSSAEIEINGHIKIIKSRNGKGSGKSIGVFFENMTFRELGVLTPQDDTKPPVFVAPHTSDPAVSENRGERQRRAPNDDENLFA